MIQIDMQMPDNCDECRFNTEYGFCKAMPDNFCGNTDDRKRPEWCPMKEQEAVEPIPFFTETGEESKNYVICGHCKSINAIMPKVTKQKYCHECGHPVLWEGR